MGTRLLPRDLNELYAHALVVEGEEAARRFAELAREPGPAAAGDVLPLNP